MPLEVTCPGKMCTYQDYLSNNQERTCGINNLDNLFLHSVGTQLCHHVHLNFLATSMLVGDLQLLKEAEYSHYFLFSQCGETGILLRLLTVDN